MLGRKLHSVTFKTSRTGLVRVPLFWKSYCVICVPCDQISCEGPSTYSQFTLCLFHNEFSSKTFFNEKN